MPTKAPRIKTNIFKKSDLAAVKLHLIYKDYQAIASKSGCAKSYVSRILNSDVDIRLTGKKQLIISVAIEFAQMRRKSKLSIAQNMSKLKSSDAIAE